MTDINPLRSIIIIPVLMNKSMKHKNCSNTLKSTKSFKMKESSQLTARTPRNYHQLSQIKKNTLQKFKSIPTINFRDQETSFYPYSNYVHENCASKQSNHAVKNIDSEPMLLYSVSERLNQVPSASKHPKSSKATNVTSNHKEIARQSTTEYNNNLQSILIRTQTILESYRQKQLIWKKQKLALQKQLMKYKHRKKDAKLENDYKDKKRKNSNSRMTIKLLKSF